LKIRQATMDDIESLLRMGRDFIGSSGIVGLKYSPGTLVALAHVLLDGGRSTILVADDAGAIVGMVGGVVGPSILDQTRIEATEFFWWVDEDARGGSAAPRMLGEFKDWAKSMGANVVRMAALEGKNHDQVAALYTRLGYKRVETHFALEV
jgi:GNAT superfamily N-acetyltransferase